MKRIVLSVCAAVAAAVLVRAATAAECRVSISAGTSGRMFSVNGGAEMYATYETSVESGTTLYVTNYVDTGAAQIAWLGLPANAAFDDRSCTFTVTKPVAVELEPVQPPTHVWVGGDTTSPNDFATVANWRDAAGMTVAEAPGSASRVLIPAPASGETLVQCAASTTFDVAELRIGCLASANAGSAVLEVRTLGTNTVSGPVRVYAGGTLRHAANPAGSAVNYRCNLEAGGDIAVNAGGSITAKGQGYALGYGYEVAGEKVGYGDGACPSHGGRSRAFGTSRSYGSVRFPVTYGSASKSYGTGAGTRGGGAIYLKTAGTLRVDGEVDASAGDQNVSNYSGAGGSVQIHARALTGSGTVWANGGFSKADRSGAGGRIAIYSTEDTLSSFSAGTIRAWSGRYGNSNNSDSSCGTVYFETTAQGAANGDLIIDDGRTVPDKAEVEINQYVTDAEVGRVLVKQGGRFKVCSNGSLTIQRGMENAGTLIAEQGSTVTLTGSDEAIFRGANTFTSFVCTVPDKTILFSTQATDLFKVADGGTCVLQGAEEHPLKLWPETSDGTWKFQLGVNAVADILYTSVSNSNAKSGVSVLAISSENLGGNSNWGFSDPIVPGAEITWTGEEDGQWMNVANWNPMRAPVETDHAVIPAGCERYPVLVAGTVLQNKVTVETDAALTLAGGNLTVTNGFACAGTFTSAGCETLLLTGETNTFAGATVNAGNGTVRFEGEFDQIFNPDGGAFAFVTFRKSGGNVTLEKGLAARVFEVTASAASVFSFAAGETFAISELYLNGAVAGAAGLTVKSTSDGSVWFLNAGARQQVGGVVACDSDASGGATILADDLSNVMVGCRNWTTGGKAATWTGGASGKWSQAGNWTPNGVPDAETRVTIAADAGQTVSVTLDAGAAAEAADLFVGTSGRGTVTLTANAPLVIGGDFDVGTNATVVLNAFNPGNTVGGDVTVRAGGKLTHQDNGTGYETVLARIKLEVDGDFTLEKGAMVDLRDKGFKGAPWGGGNGTMSAHGGRRPEWGGWTFWNGYCVGSVTEPILPGYGSHGDAYGGGAVWISADGQMRIDGDILADGTTCNSGSYYTGSGGSVYLRCAGFTGTGMISASAKGVSLSLGGSGGRIAVYQTESDSFDAFTNVTMRAYGGWDQKTPAGPPGTIYTCTRSQAASGGTGGDLWIRNGGGQFGAAEISQQMEDTTVGSVHIASGCALVVHSGRTLTVNGDFLNDGSLVCSNDSTVVFATTNNALVRGENEYYNLSCTTGDKTMRFAPQTEGNSIVRVRTGGTLTLTGTDKRHLLVLTNDVEDAAWKLALANGVEQQVMYVAVAGSDASGGVGIVAKSSRDDGNNANWNFPADIVPGEEIVWTGEVSNDFGDPSNWDRKRVPESTDFVKVVASANDPVVTHSFTGNRMEVQSGAALTLNGANLTLTNDLRCAGTLAMTDQESVRLEGNVDFTGGAYVARRETLTLGGDAAVTVNFAGNGVYDLKVAKGGGALTFTKGFSADTFTCVPGVSQSLAFGAGETFEFADLILSGSAAALTLASTAETTAWNLKVTRRASVRDVTAIDSDASAGFPVYAEGESTCTRCENWFSGADAAVKTWLGGTGNFTDAAKWDPEGVPGETNHVVVPSGTVTISTNVTVRGLTVGGGTAAAGIRVTKALTVTGGAEALTNGTFTFDAPVTLGESLIVRSGGVVTHTENPVTVTHPTNELYKIAVWAGSDIIVDKGGRITADGCGYRAGKGPGASDVALHGGTAGNYGYGGGTGKTYGSIVRPVNLGSGCGNSYGGHGVGGGAVRLTAAREVRVEGSVTVNGAARYDKWFYTGAGGSVWITAGRLTGAGTISADGGDTNNSNAGSGGRVALHLTEATDFSDWKGTVTARGGQQNYQYGRTGAGTVYRKAKGWTLGRVTIENGGSSIHPDVGTVIPPLLTSDTKADYKSMAIEVQKARLTVTNDVKVAELDMAHAEALVKCYGVLTVKSSEHEDGKGWKAPYPACETRCGGYVRWAQPGFMVIVK